MATNKNTWDAEIIYNLYKCLKKKNIKKERFMFNVYYSALEHDIVTSKTKSKAALRHLDFVKLKKSMNVFGKAFEQIRIDLIQATKNSDKN